MRDVVHQQDVVAMPGPDRIHRVLVQTFPRRQRNGTLRPGRDRLEADRIARHHAHLPVELEHPPLGRAQRLAAVHLAQHTPAARTFVLQRPMHHGGVKIHAFAQEHIGIVPAVIGQDHEIFRVPQRGQGAIAGETVQQPVKPVFRHFLAMRFPQGLDVLAIRQIFQIGPQAHGVPRWLASASSAST